MNTTDPYEDDYCGLRWTHAEEEQRRYQCIIYGDIDDCNFSVLEIDY